MEFTPSRIAGLVLGYLKVHQHKDAFNRFLEECKYFENDRQNIKMGKCFVTRVMGMSLEDFLEEYSKIYSIVQGRLEATSFYAEKRPKTSLDEELLYLLDTGPKHSSSPIYSEVETTPAHALPGNSDDASSTPNETSFKKSSRSKVRESNANKSEPLEMSGILSQSILEKPELYSKLAETINEVRNTPPDAVKRKSDDIGAGASKELDAIIKTVVERTEEDPLYNQLLNEIIGVASDNSAANKKTNSNSSSQPLNESLNRSKRVTRSSIGNESIEDVNNDAIRSIIAVSQVTDTIPSTNLSLPVQEPKTDSNNEIYVFDGPLDQYLKTSGSTGNSNAQNPLYLTTPGLLVVPQYEDASNHFYLVNNQPLVNIPNVISNNDILAMPTVIVNDEVEAAYSSSVVSDGDSTSHPTTSNKIKEEKLDKPKPISPGSGAKVSNQQKKTTPSVNNNVKKKRNDTKTTKSKLSTQPTTPVRKKAPVAKKTTPRHVRNLNQDFLTSTKSTLEPTSPPPASAKSTIKSAVPSTKSSVVSTWPPTSSMKSTVKSWDSDLRMLANSATTTVSLRKQRIQRTRNRATANNTKKDKRPSKQRKETEVVKEEIVNEKKNSVEETTKDVKLETNNKLASNTDEQPTQQTELVKNKMVDKEKNGVVEVKRNVDHRSPPKIDGSVTKNVVDALNTPLKDGIPKTPGFGTSMTPFTQVLEEQLRGLDVMSMPTPSFPITPGLALTPNLDSVPYNHRSTDYSTSSSYYVPSDTEQNKSIEQLVEECNKIKSPQKFKVLSNVVIDEAKLPSNENQKINKQPEKRVQRAAIAKKNLSLMRPETSSSSSSSGSDSNSSDSSDSEPSDETVEKTVIHNEEKEQCDIINNIISSVDVKSTLVENNNKKKLLEDLEATRRRTVEKLQMSNQKKPGPKVVPETSAKSKKNVETKKPEAAANKSINDEQAQKLVTDLWQRGIHLVPNKSPNKVAPPKPVEEEIYNDMGFDRRTYASVELATHREGNVKKLEDYDFARLEKAWAVNFYQEELERVVSRTLKCSPFELLLDVSPKILRPRGSKRNNSFTKQSAEITDAAMEQMDCETDDLMNFAVSGNIEGESSDGKSPTQGSKKRKLRNSMEERNAEKKPKKFEQNIKLLKKIDVDDFLDKVHNV